MLEIAGGIVIGGVALLLVFAFLPEIVRVALCIVGLAAGLVILWLAGELCIGAWNAVHGHKALNTLADKVFGYAVGLLLLAGSILASGELFDGFPLTRGGWKTLRRRFAKAG